MKRMNQFDTSKITSTDEKELRDALSSAVKKVDATYEFKSEAEKKVLEKHAAIFRNRVIVGSAIGSLGAAFAWKRYFPSRKGFGLVGIGTMAFYGALQGFFSNKKAFERDFIWLRDEDSNLARVTHDRLREKYPSNEFLRQWEAHYSAYPQEDKLLASEAALELAWNDKPLKDEVAEQQPEPEFEIPVKARVKNGETMNTNEPTEYDPWYDEEDLLETKSPMTSWEQIRARNNRRS